MGVLSAQVKGAEQGLLVDRHPDRLRRAEQIGAVAIDDSKAPAVEQVMERTRGQGAARGPSWVVSHHLSLDEAPEAYEHVDARDDGWTKVILHPNGH
jgi:threonine dehydrogenase-like Zn-dependent dehydrogenase